SATAACGHDEGPDMCALSDNGQGASETFRVGVLTTTRADYGHLYWLIRALQEQPAVCTHVYVTGTHLSEARGGTVAALEADGVAVHRKIPIWDGPDTPVAIAAGLGRAVERFAAALDEDRPDVMVVLGDRSEALAVTMASVILGVPVAHLHGGEIS